MKKIFTILSLSLAITATAQFEGAKQVYEAPNLTILIKQLQFYLLKLKSLTENSLKISI